MDKEFSFPKLKKSEIIPCLRQFGVDFNSDELANPAGSMEKYLRMLEYFTEYCTGITREEMGQPAFSGLGVLTFPDMHEDSIPFLNTFRACSKMMDICGIEDFSIKDFMTPCPKRLLRQLSAIINFIRFRDDKENIIIELTNTTQQLIEKLQKTKERYESANHRLSLLQDQTNEETRIISKLEHECKEIEQIISKLNLQQADIRDDSAELKSRNNDLKEAISDKSLQYDECVNLRKKLSAQIVNSPERFRKQILDVAQALQTEQRDSKAAEKRVRELSIWIGNVEEAQTEVDAALDNIQELRSEVTKQKSVLAELEAFKQDTAGKRSALVELDQNVTHVSRTITRTEDKLSQLRRQAGGRGADYKIAIQQLHNCLFEAENMKGQIRVRAEKADTDLQRMENEVELEFEAQEKERGEMVQSYQRLEAIVINHLQNLNKAMECSRV